IHRYRHASQRLYWYRKFECRQRIWFSYWYYEWWFQSCINYYRGLVYARYANSDFHSALRAFANYHRHQRNDQSHGIDDPTCQFGNPCGPECNRWQWASLALLAGVNWSKRVPREARKDRRRSI